jgi:hypothetical protein
VRSSSPHGILDGMMAIFQFAPYRCRGCRSRFYRRSVREAEDEEQNRPAENHKAG